MAVYSFSASSSTSFCLLWKIEESLAELSSQLPSEFLTDLHRSNLSYTNRILQSLAVRLALYHLLKKLDFPIVTLSKNQHGRPILGDGSVYISFTHTRYIAAVALSTSAPIGIDIEMVRPSLYSVQERFLREEEAQAANNCLEQLAIYWSAKEALCKCVDRPKYFTLKDIVIEPFQLQSPGEIVADLHQKKFVMGYQRIVDSVLPLHVLVFCENK